MSKSTSKKQVSKFDSLAMSVAQTKAESLRFDDARFSALKVDLPCVVLPVMIQLANEMLATNPNKDLAKEVLEHKRVDALTKTEEIEAIGMAAVAAKGMCVFGRDEDGVPFTFHHMFYGFLKNAAACCHDMPGVLTSKLKAYKQATNRFVKVGPRRIYWYNGVTGALITNDDIGACSRPLRANTPMGEVTAVANSETIPSGSVARFDVVCLKPALIPMVKEWLAYGIYRGLGQWRNADKGQFQVKIGDTENFVGTYSFDDKEFDKMTADSEKVDADLEAADATV